MFSLKNENGTQYLESQADELMENENSRCPLDIRAGYFE
jgi:hypothetical protein